MRLIFAIPLLMLAACDVQRDAANDQTTISLNEQRLEGTAEDLGNAVEGAGAAIENEVESLDVDIDVNRNGSAGNSN